MRWLEVEWTYDIKIKTTIMASQKRTLNLNTYMIYLSTLLLVTRAELIFTANEEPVQQSSDIITRFKFMPHQSRLCKTNKTSRFGWLRIISPSRSSLSNNPSLPSLAPLRNVFFVLAKNLQKVPRILFSFPCLKPLFDKLASERYCVGKFKCGKTISIVTWDVHLKSLLATIL